MSLSLRNIKKWWKMLRNKSILHVNQGVGRVYSFDSIKGYYNDLTEKVTKDLEHYSAVCPMTTIDDRGRELCYPVVVFQYGLGAYDLLLLGQDPELMESKFLCQLEWAFENQMPNGAWDNFGPLYPDAPFSSMAQGEGASLLLRGYHHTGDSKYLEAAKRAIDFMLKDVKDGGTSKTVDEGLLFLEFTCFPCVYNGWMFSIFGLMDYFIETRDDAYGAVLKNTLSTLANNLSRMDNGYWSMYREDNTIASPFYHNLHIAQLQVLYDYSRDERFSIYARRFESYRLKRLYRWRAFWVKAFQKVFRK